MQKTGRRKRTGGFLFHPHPQLPAPGLPASGILALLLGILLLFTRCGGYPPEILDIKHRLILFQDRQRGEIYEYLSLAIHAEDQDGPEDLESLALIHDREELYWFLTGDQWSRRQIRQENWILAEALLGPPPGIAFGESSEIPGEEPSAPPPKSLPRGLYRVVLTDYGGRKAEGSFRLVAAPADPLEPSKREEPAERFPGLSANPEELKLETPQNEAVLLVTSPSGALLGAFNLKKGSNSRESILTNSQVRTQAKNLYLYQPAPSPGEAALISGPYDAADYLFGGEP